MSDWQCNNDMHLLDIVLTTLQWVKQSRPTTGEAITHVLRTMFHHLLKKSGVVTSQTGFSAQFGTVTKSDPDNKQTFLYFPSIVFFVSLHGGQGREVKDRS